jgi:hypothetical protein
LPRSPSTYSLPPGTTPQVPNTVISSSMFTAFADDVAQTFNTVQPIVYGGTGVADGKPLDNTFGIKNNADLTKIGVFSASGIPTATTLTYNLPDSSGTLALTSDIGNSAVPTNLALSASVAGNALTISIKGFDGNDPSASNPVSIPFRSATAASGDVDILTLTAATSLVISSGSTMGFTSAIAGKLWIVGFNDAGTFRLGAVNVLSGTSIMALRDGIYSSTAEGGAGGADSAQVIYTGTAVTSKALTVLGYIEATETVAGTWATAPSAVKVLSMGDSLPGDVVQSFRTTVTGSTASAAVVPVDNTKPTSTEGVQIMTQAITPSSSANLLEVTSRSEIINGAIGPNNLTQFITRDSGDALATAGMFNITANVRFSWVMSYKEKAASSAATTYRTRAGVDTGGFTFNGAFYDNTANSFMEVKEIMA